MAWWKVKRISSDDDTLNYFLMEYVLKCPCSIENREKNGLGPNGKTRYKRSYSPVSAQNCSFKQRNITGHLLSTLLSQIRRPMLTMGTYAKIKTSESVEDTVRGLLRDASVGDPECDLVVFHERSDMPETEALFYYIRNSFAHGSFEARQTPGGRVFYLESARNGTIKARMRLKESTLERLASLKNLSADEIISLRKQ